MHFRLVFCSALVVVLGACSTQEAEKSFHANEQLKQMGDLTSSISNLTQAIERQEKSSNKPADVQPEIESVQINHGELLRQAARHNDDKEMYLALRDLSCAKDKDTFLEKDNDGKSAFFIAANQPHGKQHAFAIIVNFLLDDRTCHDIVFKEVRSLVRDKQENALRNTLIVVANHRYGVEQIATNFYHLVGSQQGAYLAGILDSILQAETKSLVLAQAYYAAIAYHDANKLRALNQIVQALEDQQKTQIVGYMLSLNSVNTLANFHDAILSEAEKLGLDGQLFSNSTSDISDLKATLDAVVIGQESAKVSLAVAIRNHYKRLDKGLKKSNILVIGPSGTGKTLMVQTIAESLDVPFAIFDASSITQAGYIGGKVKDAVVALAQKADYDLSKIERGIIFFDEIDKMAARSGRADSEEFKRQAQATLLKVIEGIEVEVPHGYSTVTVDTSKILFVCAGAFTGLSDIIATRLKNEGKEPSADIFSHVATEDLIGFGITPELLGRLPNVLTLRDLNVDDLTHILNNPKSSILEEYRALFSLQDIELHFTPGAVKAIAEKAGEFKIGARALRTVVENVMADLQFRLNHMGAIKSCTVTERVVKFNDLPIVEYR